MAPSFSLLGPGQALCPHQVCPEADRYACWAPRASERLGYVGIWAPFQGPLCHFLATFTHTEVVRWGRLLKAQPCWEPSTASEEWYQPTQCPSVAGQHTHFTDVETETPEKGAASPSDEQHPTSRFCSLPIHNGRQLLTSAVMTVFIIYLFFPSVLFQPTPPPISRLTAWALWRRRATKEGLGLFADPWGNRAAQQEAGVQSSPPRRPGQV